MAIDITKVNLALRSFFLAAAGLPPLVNRSYENLLFSPPNPPTLWVRETLIPVRTKLVANATLEMDGIIRYDSFDSTNNGTGGARTLAAAILAEFVPASGLVLNGAQISIIRSEILQGVKAKDDPWYMVPVRVRFKAFGPNP